MRKTSRATVTWISVISLVGCGGVAHSLGGNSSGGAGSDGDSGLRGNGFGGTAVSGSAGLSGRGGFSGGVGATRGAGGVGGLVVMADSGVGQGGENGSAGGASQAAGAPGFGGQTASAGGATSLGGTPGAGGNPVFIEDAGTPLMWRGQLIGYSFPSGSRAMLMRLALDRPAAPGFVQFGSDGANPPTDPSVAYPDGDSSTVNHRVFEGVQYQIRRIRTVFEYPDSVTEFEIAPADAWEGYCPTLTPIAFTDENPIAYGCVPKGPSGHDASGCYIDNAAKGGTREPVDCGKLAVCSGIGQGCRCTATECTSNTEGTVYVKFKSDGSGTIEALNGNASVPYQLHAN